MAWKSGLKVPFLTLGPSCPLQIVLLSDLAGCDSPLQIVMVIWCTFLKFEVRQIALLSAAGCHTGQGFQIQKKCTILPFLAADCCHTRLDGQHCPLRTSQLYFKAEALSKGINICLSLINKKGLSKLWRHRHLANENFSPLGEGKIPSRLRLLSSLNFSLLAD